MSWVKHPPDFSGLPIVRKVEQRFGLSGYARLLKIIEQWAVSPERQAGVVELPPADWQEALQVGLQEMYIFFSYLSNAGWLACSTGDQPGAPVRLTLLCFAEFLPGHGDVGIFVEPAQWHAWCVSELGLAASSSPEFSPLYRRWCASNVTVAEGQAALRRLMARSGDMSPHALHEELAFVRKERISQALIAQENPC